MSEESKIGKLADQLSESRGIDQNKILSILYTRIATGIELKDKLTADEKLRFDPNETWNVANKHLLEIAKADPQKALKLALSFINLPESRDPKQEAVNEWVRTSGLSMLGFDQLKETLSGFLINDSPESELLINKLKSLMEIDLSDITSSSRFGENPKGFSAIQSAYICLGLKNETGDSADKLYLQAKERTSKPDFETAYRLLIVSSPDCAYLMSRIDRS
ncbi:hypothetical protein HZB78_03630 [Candidatus Collierbacteria bacterium]|nr:hypothetical protein [Candidatus Collierbacteria bacterium]